MLHPYDHPLIQKAMQNLPNHSLITKIHTCSLSPATLTITITTEDAQRFSFTYPNPSIPPLPLGEEKGVRESKPAHTKRMQNLD